MGMIDGMTVSPEERKLGSFSTTTERVEALTSILDAPLVARAAGVSPAAVRNWIDGAEPRTDAAMALDDLRSVVAALVDGGFEPRRVKNWLLSRNSEWLAGERPIDEIARVPTMVLGAAHDAISVHRFGPEVAASLEGGAIPPAAGAASNASD
jgi:hypothetical protein